MKTKRLSKQEIYNELYKRSQVCGICDRSLEQEYGQYLLWQHSPKSIKRTSINLDIDHVIPKSRIKGQHWWTDLDNLQLSHRECNQMKGNSFWS